MEGNLTRARSSLYITPSASMSSSIHSSSPLTRSTPSPPGADRRIIAGLGMPPAKHRQPTHVMVGKSSPGHIRVSSETSIPSALQTPPHMPRSPGIILATPPTRSEKENTYVTHPSPSPRNSEYVVRTLEPLSEDEPTTPIEDRYQRGVRASTAEPRSNILYDHRGLTRSASSTQMRDLTDKMKDLKGKISTLRDRAREDNMKRRSLQSLRTPSPFTAAEQWYTSSNAYRGSRPSGTGLANSPWNGEPSVTETVEEDDEKLDDQVLEEEPQYKETGVPADYQDVKDRGQVEVQPEEAPFDEEAPVSSSENDDNYDTAMEEEEKVDHIEDNLNNETDEQQYDDELIEHNELDDYRSESEASLYHDTMTAPMSHEDREDAFDYEHFFLHSAMGTITQQRLARKGSTDSFSSEDSVETTRGPEASTAAIKTEVLTNGVGRGHVRSQKSTDSVSTMATFETATEGRRSSDIQADEVDDYIGRAVTSPFREEVTPPMPKIQSNHSPPSQISRPPSVIRATSAQAKPTKLHKNTSISSFASSSSTKTTRSFPLVNKPRASTMTSTSTSTPERKNSVVSEALAFNGLGKAIGFGKTADFGKPAEEQLAKEDQILLERLMTGLGACVEGLQEAGRASSEGRMWRRRLDAARRILEGQEGAV